MLSDRITYYAIIMANPLKSMEFLKRKAEELRGKGARRVQGTHPVPGSRPRRLREGDWGRWTRRRVTRRRVTRTGRRTT